MKRAIASWAFAAAVALGLGVSVSAAEPPAGKEAMVFCIGTPDGSSGEFGCAPERWPAFLKVDLGPTTKVAGRNLNETPVIIRIPKGSPPANHLGTETAKCARIVLETSHPRAPKLLIRVQFAVEG